MDNKETDRAKEYLGKVKKIDALIDRLLSTVSSLRLGLTSINCNPSAEKIQTSGANSRIEETFCRISELEEKINANIDMLIALKADAIQKINQLPDLEQRNVLIARYIEGKKWEQIALETNYSMRQVYREHRAALKNFSEILKDGTQCHF